MKHCCALLLMCMWLMAGCTEELGVTSAALVPDDETKLACPSGPHEIAGRGHWAWGGVDVDLGPYDDEATANTEGQKECNRRTTDAVKRTDDAAIAECKEDIARVGCALGADDKACDPKATVVKECEVTQRWGGLTETELGRPKRIQEKYYVNCKYSATSRVRGKTKVTCELRR
jgi:hypothetical protein